MDQSNSQHRTPGRPRTSIDSTVFAATLDTVHDLGYNRATVDRIAAAAGVAKTTIYRRWPTKGALITACLVDSFGELPLKGDDKEADLTSGIRWAAEIISQPGFGAAFAGVFTDAINDPQLRDILTTQLQDPYRLALQEALGLPEDRVLFIVDVVAGTLLHRFGISGEPMADQDVETLIDMMVRTARTF